MKSSNCLFLLLPIVLLGLPCSVLNSRADIVAEWDAEAFATGGSTWPGTVDATVFSGAPTSGSDIVSFPGSSIGFVNFDGSSVFEVAAAANPLVGLQEFSVSLVFRSTSNGAGAENDFWLNEGLVGVELGGAGVGDWGIGLATGGAINAGTGLPQGDVGALGPVVNNGAWRVVSFVVDQNDLDPAAFDQRLYLDGAEVASDIGLLYGGTTTIADSSFYFGSHLPGTTPNLRGSIAQIRLDNAALTAAEVSTAHADFLGTLVPVDDTDTDDLSDDWELSWDLITTLAQLDGKAAGPGPGAGSGDFDGDGLLDIEEQSNSTDPTDEDSDDDELLDGDEVNNLGTDPTLADSDGDSIGDGTELAGSNGFVTDPLKSDTDEDGFDDGAEIAASTDPTDPASYPNALIAHWNSDDVSTGPVAAWVDRISSISAAGLGAPQPSKGADGIFFDGIDDSFEVAAADNPLAGSSKFTLTSVFKVIQGSTRGPGEPDNIVQWWANSALVGRELGGADRGDYGLSVNGEHELLGGWGAPDGGVLNNGVALNDNEVHVASATFHSANGVSLYLDGVLVGSSSNKGIAVEAETMNFGTNILDVENDRAYFNGNIQQILLHSAALGALPIEMLHANLASTGDDFRATSIVYDPNAGTGGNGQFTLEWNSREGVHYAIYRSFDLQDWSTDVDDDIPSQGASTSLTFDNPEPGSEWMFFRVIEL